MAEETKQGRAEKILRRPLVGDEPPNLKQRPRAFETGIRYFLMACGAVSILTTIGIVVVLGIESVGFFTQIEPKDTQRDIVRELAPDDTQIPITVTGTTIREGDIIRLDDERIRVDVFNENRVNVNVTGTGGGFQAFCEGDAHIANASRQITQAERNACQENGIDPLELRVGTDAIVIATNSANDFVDDLTLDELRRVFSEAETWADVREGLPDEPIVRYIPDAASGTFDFFLEAVYGDAATNDTLLAMNPFMSERDSQLVSGIAREEYAIGFFGYSFFQNNQDDLNALTIEGIAPNAQNAENGDYLLARPLFIYTSAEILEDNPNVDAFVAYYLRNVSAYIQDVGYFPASASAMDAAQAAYLSARGMDAMPETNPATVNGTIETVGSSTIAPLTERSGREFREAGFVPTLQVTRGWEDTEAVAHDAGKEIEREIRATLGEFFTNTRWEPQANEFGILPLVTATLTISAIAMFVSLPLGLGSAIYLSEYAPQNVRATLKPILEILAGIPTVVYGYFALYFMTPLLDIFLPLQGIYNMLSAGIVVGILIIPLMSSLSEDALRAVPRALREASYGLGATKLETVRKVVIPAALSGLVAAFIVSISRAIGETMIVALAAGAGSQFTINPFEAAETITGYIARISSGDVSRQSLDYNAIFALGLALFCITLVLNIISRQIIKRFREAY